VINTTGRTCALLPLLLLLFAIVADLHVPQVLSASSVDRAALILSHIPTVLLVLLVLLLLLFQVHASLIVVLTRGGSTARLVAKYRPLVPVLTVAVPVLTTDSLTWTCSNEAPARQVRAP